jgi:hypothetical protein
VNTELAVMESSEEEDDFPSIESIIPQSKVDSLYQSQTEKVRFFLFHFTINSNAFLPTFLFFLFLGKGKLIWGYLHSNYIFVSEFRFAMLMFKFNQKLLKKKKKSVFDRVFYFKPLVSNVDFVDS